MGSNDEILFRVKPSVYTVYYRGKPIGEISFEYLLNLSSSGIPKHPINPNIFFIRKNTRHRLPITYNEIRGLKNIKESLSLLRPMIEHIYLQETCNK